jgi:hypothetical protein
MAARLRDTRLPCILLFLCCAPAARAAGCRPGPAAELTSVDHYFYDAALRLCWAVVVNCRHPEWPATLVPVSLAAGQPAPVPSMSASTPPHAATADTNQDRISPAAASRLPLVLAGSSVELWKQGAVRVQLSAIAAQSAPLGGVLAVRLPGQAGLLHGVVRGMHSVEMIGDGRPWRGQ